MEMRGRYAARRGRPRTASQSEHTDAPAAIFTHVTHVAHATHVAWVARVAHVTNVACVVSVAAGGRAWQRGRTSMK